MDLFNTIRQIIVSEWILDKDEVVPEALLQDDLGADSLALLNLAQAISLQCKVDIKGDDLADIESVGELVALVEARMQ